MPAPNGITSVLFDLDGTLKLYRPDGTEVFIQHARNLGLPISGEDRLRAIRWEHYYWASSLELDQDMQGFEKDADAFWVKYSLRSLIALGTHPRRAEELAPQLQAYMRGNHHPAHALPEGALTALQTLKAQGFTLGVLSNRDKPFGPELDELGLAPYLDFSLAGGEVGAFKPAPAIFEHTLRRAHARPEQAVYVGDNYFADVVGASRAGLRPVLYDPRGIYPDAGCAVITAFDQLLPALQTL